MLKVWYLIIFWVVAAAISIGGSIGLILLCIWLGAKIVKAVL